MTVRPQQRRKSGTHRRLLSLERDAFTVKSLGRGGKRVRWLHSKGNPGSSPTVIILEGPPDADPTGEANRTATFLCERVREVLRGES